MGIGMTLKSILRNRKMTIKQLSEESGISINTLYSITKRDSERVDEVILQRIADTLGIPVYELTGIWGELDKYKVEVSHVQNVDGTPMSPEKRKEAETILSQGSKSAYECLTIEQRREFWKIFVDDALNSLNGTGMQKVAEYSMDLAQIAEYQREQPETTPQSTPAPQEDKDTTPPPDVPETPSEGK